MNLRQFFKRSVERGESEDMSNETGDVETGDVETDAGNASKRRKVSTSDTSASKHVVGYNAKVEGRVCMACA